MIARTERHPPPRILVVENGPEERRLLADTLRSAGMEPILAAEGAEALDLLRRYQGIDVAVVDLRTPGLSGPSLFRELRRAVPGLYVAMVAGEASPEEIRAGYRAGAATLLRKPLRPQDFRATIEGSLPQARRMRRSAEHVRTETVPRRFLHELRSSYQDVRTRNRFLTWIVTLGAIVFGIVASRGVEEAFDLFDRARLRAVETLGPVPPPPLDSRAARRPDVHRLRP